MPAARFVDQLNAQIGNELFAHNQYLSIAAHYDSLTMPQMAAFFYAQANEEREHGLMMVQYLLDTDSSVKLPGVAAPVTDREGILAPVELALEQEKQVTEQINALLRIAREESDFASEQFTHWFLKEQVEETSTMSDLVTWIGRTPDDINSIEDYVAREHAAGGSDPTAPRIAGR